VKAIIYDDYATAGVAAPRRGASARRFTGAKACSGDAGGINRPINRLRRGEMRVVPGGFPRWPGYDVAGTIAECADDSSFRG